MSPHPSARGRRRVLLPGSQLLGTDRAAAPWCALDLETREWRVVDGPPTAVERALSTDAPPQEELQVERLGAEVTLALCSRYLGTQGVDRTSGPAPRPAAPPNARARRHPSAGGLGAVRIVGRANEHLAAPGGNARLVADLGLLTRRYRQPRSAYLPFIEAGHILENLALDRAVDRPEAARPGERSGAPTAHYTVRPALTEGALLRLASIGGADGDAPSAPTARAVPVPVVNPSLLLAVTSTGFSAVTSWPRARAERLDTAGFDALTRFLRHGHHHVSAAESEALLAGGALVAERPPHHADLTRRGWHGALIGWLGAPNSAAGPCRPLRTAPLLDRRALSDSYARRRSTHHFSGRPVGEQELQRALAPVCPDDQDVRVYVVPGDRTRAALRWNGSELVPAATGPGDGAGGLRARPAVSSPAGFIVLAPADLAGGLADALIRLGRTAQRIVLSLTAHDLASCVLHVDDDAAARALVGEDNAFEPTYCVAFGGAA